MISGIVYSIEASQQVHLTVKRSEIKRTFFFLTINSTYRLYLKPWDWRRSPKKWVQRKKRRDQGLSPRKFRHQKVGERTKSHQRRSRGLWSRKKTKTVWCLGTKWRKGAKEKREGDSVKCCREVGWPVVLACTGPSQLTPGLVLVLLLIVPLSVLEAAWFGDELLCGTSRTCQVT